MMFERARATITSSPGGRVEVVEGDVADVDGIVSAVACPRQGCRPRTVRRPRRHRESSGRLPVGRRRDPGPGQPIAVLLLSTLAHVHSSADAAKVVAALMDSAPSGSYLAMYHLASDLDPALAARSSCGTRSPPSRSCSVPRPRSPPW